MIVACAGGWGYQVQSLLCYKDYHDVGGDGDMAMTMAITKAMWRYPIMSARDVGLDVVV